VIWLDSTGDVSSENSTGRHLVDEEHPAQDLAVGGLNPSRRAPSARRRSSSSWCIHLVGSGGLWRTAYQAGVDGVALGLDAVCGWTETPRPEAAIVGAVLGEGGAVSVNYEGQGEPRRSAYGPPMETPEQVLARGRPFPPA